MHIYTIDTDDVGQASCTVEPWGHTATLSTLRLSPLNQLAHNWLTLSMKLEVKGQVASPALCQASEESP